MCSKNLWMLCWRNHWRSKPLLFFLRVYLVSPLWLFASAWDPEKNIILKTKHKITRILKITLGLSLLMLIAQTNTVSLNFIITRYSTLNTDHKVNNACFPQWSIKTKVMLFSESYYLFTEHVSPTDVNKGLPQNSMLLTPTVLLDWFLAIFVSVTRYNTPPQPF